MTRFIPFLLVALWIPLSADAQPDPDRSCYQAIEIVFRIPEGSEEQFYIRAWHLDDYLAYQNGDTSVRPVYGPPGDDVLSEKDWGPPLSAESAGSGDCVWSAETNWDGRPAFDEPPGPEYQDPYFAYLPPNTPYVIDIREVTGTNYQFAFSYFIPAGYNPNWEGGFIPPEFNSEAHGFYAPYKYPGFYPADVIRQTANTDLVISWDNIDNKIDLKPDSYQLSDGVSDVIGNFFGEDVADLWVLPYDYDAVCLANPNATCELEERVRTVFISPQIGYDYTFAPVDVDVNEVLTWTWTEASVRTVRFQPGTKLIAKGEFVAEDVKLSVARRQVVPQLTGASRWGGVVVAGGSVEFDGVIVEHAETGVTVYQPGTATIANNSILRHNGVGLDVRSSAGVTVQASAIRENGIGVQTDFVDDYGTGVVCRSGCLSRLTLEGAQVSDNAQTGIVLRNAEGVQFRDFDGVRPTTISGNGLATRTHGLVLWNAAFDEFRNTHVEHNAINGVIVGDNSDLGFTDELGAPGLDRIAENGSHEIVLSEGGYLFLGTADGTNAGGFSDVYDPNLHPDNRLIYYACSGICPLIDIEAENIYWGSPSGPPVGAFEGLYVDTSPFLTAPATSANRAVPSVLADASTAGRGEGTMAWLRQAIREARRGLEEGPGAEGAAGLVRRLYGLQRLDADDLLGERPATMARLAALRSRLGQGTLPARLRAAAEAALVAEVHEALRVGAFDEAAALITAFEDIVEEASARRALTLSRVMAYEQAGRYVEALDALSSVTAELDAEDPLFGVLDAVAEALVAKGGEGAAGRSGGAARATVSARSAEGSAGGKVLEAPYPNPAQGATTIALRLPENTRADVSVYDMLGRRVASLADGHFEAGAHRLAFDGVGLPPGVYVIRATVEAGEGGTQVYTQRLTLVK